MKSIILLFLLISIPFNIYSQNNITINFSAKKDSLDKYTDSLIKTRIEKDYTKLLENVNTQVNLASNPFSYLIGSLGVLFTVFAIIASFLIYQQSNDFKQQREKLINSAKEEFKVESDKMNSDFNEKVKTFEEAFNAFFEPNKKELEKVITSIGFENLQKAIKDIKPKELNSITVKVSKDEIKSDGFTGRIIDSKICGCCGEKYYLEYKGVAKGYYDVIKSVCPFCLNYEEQEKKYYK